MNDYRVLVVPLMLALGGLPVAGRAQDSPQFQPAPVPNPDVRPPRAAGGSDTSLTPHLFMPPDRFAGDGYTPGSSVQGEQERHLRPGAGMDLRLTFD